MSKTFISLGDHLTVVNEDNSKHPYCKHGPTLLFCRYLQTNQTELFYACSACRNQNECSFYSPFKTMNEVKTDSQRENNAIACEKNCVLTSSIDKVCESIII